MKFRQILRALGKTPKGCSKLCELLHKRRHKLQEREFLVLDYTYLKKLSTFNIAGSMGISCSHYQNILNLALSKFEMLISDIEMREIIEII